MTCELPKKPAPPAYGSLTACAKLAVIEEALMKLGTGATKVQVRYSDQWVEYAPGNVMFLERERARLERLCATERGDTAGARRAITIGRTGGRCR